MSRPKSKVATVVVRGPLAPFMNAYEAELRDVGYTPLGTVKQLRQVARLSRWLEQAGMGAADLTDGVLERFVAVRPGLGTSSAPGLAALLVVLRRAGGGRRDALYLFTEDVDAVHERVQTASAEIMTGPHETQFGADVVAQAFTVKDTEGNLWTIGTTEALRRPPREDELKGIPLIDPLTGTRSAMRPERLVNRRAGRCRAGGGGSGRR